MIYELFCDTDKILFVVGHIPQMCWAAKMFITYSGKQR